jgi:hypothetical protein
MRLLPENAFYDPSYYRPHLKELYQENEPSATLRFKPPYDGKYGQHLWHAHAVRYLQQIKLEHICNSTSMYASMVRFALSESPWLKDHCSNNRTTMAVITEDDMSRIAPALSISSFRGGRKSLRNRNIEKLSNIIDKDEI